MNSKAAAPSDTDDDDWEAHLSCAVKDVVLTLVDESAYARLLRENFPTFAVLPQIDLMDDRKAVPRPSDRFPEPFTRGWQDLFFYVGQLDWRPEFKWDKEHRHWRLKNAILPNGTYIRSTPAYMVEPIGNPRKPPEVGVGTFMFRFRRDRPAEKRVVDKAVRLLKKVTTNRIAYVMLPLVPGAPRPADPKGGMYWAGHDALRWAREDRRRVLAVWTAGGALVPPDE